MCRSKADGGRRCTGHDTTGPRESYQGTPWQGYDEAQQRAEEFRRQLADGKSGDDIMRESVAQRARDRIAQIAREGW